MDGELNSTQFLDGITARLGGERSLSNISRSSDVALGRLDHRNSGDDHRSRSIPMSSTI